MKLNKKIIGLGLVAVADLVLQHVLVADAVDHQLILKLKLLSLQILVG